MKQPGNTTPGGDPDGATSASPGAQKGGGEPGDERGGPTPELLSRVYDELRELARSFLRRERPDHTLQATALVHELYLRLAGQRVEAWQNEAQFFAVATRMIRRILINHAHGKSAQRRGGSDRAESLSDQGEPADRRASGALDLLVVDELLERLAELDPRQAQIVELRLFGGFGVAEVARLVGVSERTVSGEWALGRAWLRAALRRSGEER